MTTYIFIIITLSIRLSIILTLSPLSIGAWVLILALLTATCTAISITSWFGFIIFLIYIGGILVIFAYFRAIQPNQQFKITLPLLSLLLSSIIIPAYLDPSTINNFPLKNWWITAIYAPINIPSLIFLALTLFLALISIVKISFINRAPLRPFSYV